MDNRRYLGVVDYVIFGITLLISSVIGIYFGCKKRREVASPTEYLLAGRDVPWFPIFVSLVVSFFSPVGVMGVTAQIYATGITFALQGLAFFAPIALNALILAPIFRKLQLVSVNEYLERRFSKKVRLFGSFFFVLQYLLYLSIVLYAPSLALETVANVPKVMTILVTGAICIFYTTLGGMRAVIWTDVFQAVIMLVGLLSTAIIGIINIGSFDRVSNIALKYQRLQINYDPDPRSYHTIWGALIGTSFAITNPWTITQPTVQRVASARSLKDAQKALCFSFVGIAFIHAVLALDALVIFASFYDCDLKLSGQIKAPDQALPYFVVTKLGHLEGVSGLFSASLFCFSLSTLSSALNSMSAVILEDIVKTIQPSITEERQTVVSKIIVCIFGAFVTGFSFVVPALGNFIVKLATQLFGVIGGPYFGMFAMGIFTRRSNAIGATFGSLAGFSIGMMFSIGQMFYPPDMQLPPVSLAGCSNDTLHGNFNSTTLIFPKIPPNYNNSFSDVVSISYLWHGMISIGVTCLVCYLVSIFTAKLSIILFFYVIVCKVVKKSLKKGCCQNLDRSQEIDPELMFSFTLSCSSCKEEDEINIEIYDQDLKVIINEGVDASLPTYRATAPESTTTL